MLVPPQNHVHKLRWLRAIRTGPWLPMVPVRAHTTPGTGLDFVSCKTVHAEIDSLFVNLILENGAQLGSDVGNAEFLLF